MFWMLHPLSQDMVKSKEWPTYFMLPISWNFFLGMIKGCVWNGRRLNCSSIFSMYPTDRGMCCTFNKQKANEMFRKSRYQDQIDWLTDQDKDNSIKDSTLPIWKVPWFDFIKEQKLWIDPSPTRFDPVPQSGKSKGLALMLDAHSDLITKSSTPNEFQV